MMLLMRQKTELKKLEPVLLMTVYPLVELLVYTLMTVILVTMGGN